MAILITIVFTIIVIIALCVRYWPVAGDEPTLDQIQKIRDITHNDPVVPPLTSFEKVWKKAEARVEARFARAELKGTDERVAEMKKDINSRGKFYLVKHTDAPLMCDTCKKQDCDELADGECYNCLMNREAQEEKHGDSPEYRE